jgi:hypothetical protein
MDDTPNFKSRIRQFFTAHPWFGFICFLGAVASIIGLVFSVFPWLAASRKDLSFCINPVRTPIVQIAKQSDVSVSYRGIPVIGNVTAVQIAIWNAGREPIKGDDVLRPIILHMATNQIMEASILKTTRDVSEFQLVSNSIASNSIGMKCHREQTAQSFLHNSFSLGGAGDDTFGFTQQEATPDAKQTGEVRGCCHDYSCLLLSISRVHPFLGISNAFYAIWFLTSQHFEPLS